MSGYRLDRRSFLTGTFASVPLIGTAMAAGSNQAENVPALKGSRNSVVIPTHEFAGNLDERLDFPADWNVHVMDMAGHNAPVLTEQQIGAKLAQPIGTKTLRELAAGKRRVVITFDDLTRATPTYTVAPWVVGELKAAGVADENILFLSSYGTHRPMVVTEIQKKLGPEIVKRYAWTNHNCFDNLKDVGETSFKNKIRLNQTFLAADVKICLSGIKVHDVAGYGGGAKAVLPGVAALSTVEYNHTVILPNTKTAGPVRVFKNEMRLDMVEAARMANVDFTVQVIYNQKLRPTAVFSGDIVHAHHASVRVAAKHYCTKTFKNADIVVSNAYPQCAQADHAGLWISRSIKEGGTGVLIVQHPLALDPIHFLGNRQDGKSGASYFDLTTQQLDGPAGISAGPGNTALIVYSQYTDRTQMNYYSRGTHFCDKWADVIKILQRRHKGTVEVAVYPYGGIQHEEIELDG
jgi:nickel-dependent lactate racemase